MTTPSMGHSSAAPATMPGAAPAFREAAEHCAARHDATTLSAAERERMAALFGGFMPTSEKNRCNMPTGPTASEATMVELTREDAERVEATTTTHKAPAGEISPPVVEIPSKNGAALPREQAATDPQASGKFEGNERKKRQSRGEEHQCTMESAGDDYLDHKDAYGSDDRKGEDSDDDEEDSGDDDEDGGGHGDHDTLDIAEAASWPAPASAGLKRPWAMARAGSRRAVMMRDDA